MELVEGPNLGQTPPHDLQQVIEFACQICAALEHAHNNNIVHRDLKPANVLLAGGGGLRTQDSGLKTQDSGLRTQNSRLKSQASKDKAQSSKLRVQIANLRTPDSGLRTPDSKVRW